MVHDFIISYIFSAKKIIEHDISTEIELMKNYDNDKNCIIMNIF